MYLRALYSTTILLSFSVGSVTTSYPYSIKNFEDMDGWRTDDNQIFSKSFWFQKHSRDQCTNDKRKACAKSGI